MRDIQNLSILCNAGAVKREQREIGHVFQNERSVKPYIQNTVCMRGCHMCGGEVFPTQKTLNIKRKIKFGAA